MVADGPNLVTEAGAARIDAEVARIEAALKSETNVLLRETLERDLRYWAVKKARVQVVAAPTGDTVAFGSRVTIARGGKRQSFRIVGEDEAEPRAGPGVVALAAGAGHPRRARGRNRRDGEAAGGDQYTDGRRLARRHAACSPARKAARRAGFDGPDFAGGLLRAEERLGLAFDRRLGGAVVAEQTFDLVLEFERDVVAGALAARAHRAHHRPAAQALGVRLQHRDQVGEQRAVVALARMHARAAQGRVECVVDAHFAAARSTAFLKPVRQRERAGSALCGLSLAIAASSGARVSPIMTRCGRVPPLRLDTAQEEGIVVLFHPCS